MKKYLITLLLFFFALASQGQAPDIYKLVYDSMELVTGGVSSTKTTTIRKDQDYKAILLEVPTGHDGYEVIISFKPKIVVDPTPVFLDNLANLVVNSQLVNTYTPASAWSLGNVAGHHGGTIQFSNVANSTLETKFTGTKIVWIAEKKSTHGSAGVSIDGGLETIIDLKNATELKQQEVYTSPTLTRGLHTIKIRVVGNGYVVTDAFKVTP